MDGDDFWWKLVIVLNRATEGGVLSIAKRCDPCTCLSDGRCLPLQAMDVDLQPGDGYGIWAGRICHGVSTVAAGARATWALRYLREPDAIGQLMALRRCSRLEISGIPPRFGRE